MTPEYVRLVRAEMLRRSLGLPGRVVQLRGGWARCVGRGSEQHAHLPAGGCSLRDLAARMRAEAALEAGREETWS